MVGNTDFADFAKYLEEVAPKIVEEFNEGYEDPVHFGNVCQRCFSSVYMHHATKHNEYHRSLSLAMFALGTTLHSVVSVMEPETEENG